MDREDWYWCMLWIGVPVLFGIIIGLYCMSWFMFAFAAGVVFACMVCVWAMFTTFGDWFHD